MERIKCLEKVITISEHIEKRRTGSVKSLSKKINTSEKTVYRLLPYIEKLFKRKISYCRKDETLYFDADK